ncbi:substrate-binding periplasmic protein [Balneatrix alpica]|uniref:substrate-binding periplasmic protein n=1 Tax=Balneatrix alpica TaxID=75684 RepID=UPI0027391AF4|nr:transporter substrate-binding domain-containing protein [Balneatrix alpica]
MRKIITACLLAALAPFASADKFVGAGDPWPPFLDPEQDTQGVAIEIVRAALESQGHQLEFKFMTWAEAIDGVTNANYDLLVGTWFTEERTMFLVYSEPYLKNEIKFIKRKGDAFEFSGLNTLEGKKVGIISGYGYSDSFVNDLTFERPEASDLMTNVKALIAGEIDLTLEDELVARSTISRHQPELLEQIEFTNGSLSSQSLHVTTGLVNDKRETIIEAVNKGLEAIKANGVFDEILQRNGLK